MIDPKTLIDDLIDSLRSFSDEKRIEFSKTIYPTRMTVIGVSNPNLKKVIKELKPELKSFSMEEKKHFFQALIDTDVFECQQLAYEILGNDKQVFKSLSEQEIDALGKNLDNWVSVDYYSALIVGYAWREGILTTEKIKNYLSSNDYWIRRIALVATVSLNQKARGGQGDPERTLEICELALDDHQDMINKALSWALRELAKREKELVRYFVEKYKDRMHKRVYREVTNKLEKGTKN